MCFAAAGPRVGGGRGSPIGGRQRAGLNINDLTLEQRKEFGLRMPQQTDFTKEDLRVWC